MDQQEWLSHLTPAQRAAWGKLVERGKRENSLDITEVLDTFPTAGRGASEHAQTIDHLVEALTELGIQVSEASDDEIDKVTRIAERGERDIDSLRMYAREAGRHRILSREEEVELCRRIRFYEAESARLLAEAAEIDADRERRIRERAALMEKPVHERTDEDRSQIRQLARVARRLEDDAAVVREAASVAASKAQATKHEFELFNLKLVMKLARQHIRPGIEALDLIQAGNEGMLRALDKFDPELGWKFSTYATYYIRQAIQTWVNDNKSLIRVPNHMGREISEFNAVRNEMRDDLGRDPTLEELADRLGKSEAKLHQIRRVERITPSSLNATFGEDAEGLEIGDRIQDPNALDPEEVVIGKLVHSELETAIEEYLNPKERRVIMLRFGFGTDGDMMTLEEVGKQLKVTRERIRQIESRALKKLRASGRLENLAF